MRAATRPSADVLKTSASWSSLGSAFWQPSDLTPRARPPYYFMQQSSVSKTDPLSAVLTQLCPARRQPPPPQNRCRRRAGELVLLMLAGVAAPPPSQPREQLLAPIQHDGSDLLRSTLLRRFLQPELCLWNMPHVAMSEHSLSNVGRSSGAATWLCFWNKTLVAEKKNLHNQNISFLSETKDMLQKIFWNKIPVVEKKFTTE